MAMVFNVAKVKKMTSFRMSKEFISQLNNKVLELIKETISTAEATATEKKQKTLLV